MSEKKVIGIYLRLPNLWDYPLTLKMKRYAYVELMLELMVLGMHPVLVRTPESYEGQGRFTQHWELVTPAVAPYKMIKKGPITVDVLFDRGKLFEVNDDMSIPRLNHPELSRIASNKYETNKLFGDMQPHSIIVSSRDEVIEGLKSIRSDLAVLKAFEGNSGMQVLIKPKSVLAQQKVLPYPLKLQEFIDTSEGIPGVSKGVHDMRFTIFNGEPISIYGRFAKKGRLHSNIGMGGTAKKVALRHIPSHVIKMVKAIDKKLEVYGDRFYSIDFVRSKEGQWYMLELNSTPGFFDAYSEPGLSIDVRKKTARQLVKMAKNSKVST